MMTIPGNKGRIARRLILYIVLFSSLITLVATAVQIYSEYSRDIDSIDLRLQQIRTSYLQGITEAVWVADHTQLQLMLTGIQALQDMEYVEVRVDDKIYDSSGVAQTRNVIDLSTDLVYDYRGSRQTIGHLTVQASLDGVYARLWSRLWIILVANGVKTFFVALFIYFLFDKLVTRHLHRIADYLVSHDPSHPGEALRLDRARYKEGPVADELDLVVSAINRMQQNLGQSLQETRNYRDNLERLVAERTAALESFSYSVSHDLRSPLRRINGFSQLLLEEQHDRLDAEGQAYLQRIVAATRRMGRLIDDLLQLSRLSRHDLHMEEVDLSGLAMQVIGELKQQSPGRSVDVSIEAAMSVTGDRGLLRIMLENLLGNAWKYSSKTRHARIEFASTRVDGRPSYYVRDNGVGFDMRYADKLFAAFQRLHGDEFEGTGIGLVTVERIVKRHGGHIWAEARPGEGATFYFNLSGSPA
jgi:signal transduction histidine kinase